MIDWRWWSPFLNGFWMGGATGVLTMAVLFLDARDRHSNEMRKRRYNCGVSNQRNDSR